MKNAKIPLFNARLWVLVCVFGLQTTSGWVNAQILSDDQEQTIELVVMVKSQVGLGAGILFGRKDGLIYIATSNHIVRRGEIEAQDIQVILKSLPGQWLEANLAEHFDANPDVDLAVLTLKNPTQPVIDFCALPLNRLGDTNILKRGGTVYPVGYPNGALWAIPVIPDQISQIVGKEITFQSAFISNGHSGGGLLNKKGELIGMIRGDQPPFGIAINIAEILTILRQWGYPVQLHTKSMGKILLHLAVEKRNLDETARLLKACFDPNAIGDEGKTPLHIAAAQSDQEIAQLLISSGAMVNVRNDHGKTPLHIAAAQSDQEITQLLINSGATVNVRDDWRKTPLQVAVSNGHLVVVKQLMSGGADVDYEALLLAFENLEILDFLLAQQPQLSPYLLNKAVEKRHVEVVKRLLANGIDVNKSKALYLSAKQCDTTTATILLAKGSEVNKGQDEESPLYIAAKNDCLPIVNLLLANGANVDSEYRGRTALREALRVDEYYRHANLPIVQALLKAGGKFEALGRAEKHLLAKLVRKRELDPIKLLLDHGFDPNNYDREAENPLGIAIGMGQLEIARLLVSHGANVNAEYDPTWDSGGTLLIYAIYSELSDGAKLLIEAGADVEVSYQWYYQYKPLHLAALYRLPEVVECLLDHGAKVNSRTKHGESPLMYAMKKKPSRGWNQPPEDFASRKNREEIVRILLSHGAYPDASGSSESQLLFVVREGNLKIAKMLINAGADLDARDSKGNTPLHLAAEKKKGAAMARMLIEVGADLSAVNKSDETALMVAERSDSDAFEVIQAKLNEEHL